jgi:hypothetical protein
MVKDPTQPGPSMVTKVKDSSLNILYQIYSVTGGFYINYRYIREGVCNYRGFPAGGHTILRGVARSGKRRGLWEKEVLGILGMA